MSTSPPPRPVDVAVVNDYPLVTEGVVGLLRPFADRVRVTGYAGDLPAHGTADIVLFDPFGHPRPQERLTEIVESTGARVLVFGWADEPRELADARERGAAGYLSKTADGARILAALESVAGGADAWPAVPVAGAELDDWPGRTAGLSERESEVICLITQAISWLDIPCVIRQITQGMSNQEIAETLYLSINSIKSYIRTGYAKMGVQRRSQAVLWGIDHGMRPGGD